MNTISADYINAVLRDVGSFVVPPGNNLIDGTIRLDAGMRLSGHGFASKLYPKTSDNKYLVVIGADKTAIYGTQCVDVCIVKSGVFVDEASQHSVLARVWASEAPEDGFFVRNGEKLKLDQCVAWGNRRKGFNLSSDGHLNGILLDNCNAQSNAGGGLNIETSNSNAEIAQTVIRDCTIQGNGSWTSEIRVAGYVNHTRIENLWCENPNAQFLIRCEETNYPGVTRYPIGLVFVGNNVVTFAKTVINPGQVGISLRGCMDPEIEQLILGPRPSCKLQWFCSPTGSAWWRGQPPTGARRLLLDSQIEPIKKIE